MMKSFWLAGAVLVGSFSAIAHADSLTLLAETDARPGKKFEVFVTTDAQGDATGMIVKDGTPEPLLANLTQIRSKAVLYQEEYKGFTFEVLTLSAPKFSAKNGGPVTLRYLKNGLSRNFEDFPLVIERQGSSWVASTPFAQGKRAVRNLFLHKNTIFKQVVGIKSIEIQ